MSQHGKGPDRAPAGRWPVSMVLSLLLILLIGTIAARLYPDGRLKARIMPPMSYIILSAVPEIEVEPPPLPQSVEDPEEKPPPPVPPQIDPLAAGLEARLLEQIDTIWDAAPETALRPALVLPAIELFRQALRDSIHGPIPLVTQWLFAGSWQANKAIVPLLMHQDKAQRIQANKRSIFNEDWLSNEVLK